MNSYFERAMGEAKEQQRSGNKKGSYVERLWRKSKEAHRKKTNNGTAKSGNTVKEREKPFSAMNKFLFYFMLYLSLDTCALRICICCSNISFRSYRSIDFNAHVPFAFIIYSIEIQRNCCAQTHC